MWQSLRQSRRPSAGGRWLAGPGLRGQQAEQPVGTPLAWHPELRAPFKVQTSTRSTKSFFASSTHPFFPFLPLPEKVIRYSLGVHS